MAGSIYDWSTTVGDNDDADAEINWLEGQLPSTVNNSARAMMKRVAEFIDGFNFNTVTTGSANTLALTTPVPWTTLADGLIVVCKISVTCTGPTTLAVNSTAAKSVRKIATSGDVPIGPNDLRINDRKMFIYSTAANSAAGGWIMVPTDRAEESLPINIGEFFPETGAPARLAMGGIGPPCLVFGDTGTELTASWVINPPSNWTAGELYGMVFETCVRTATASGDVRFDLELCTRANGAVPGAAEATHTEIITTGATASERKTTTLTFSGALAFAANDLIYLTIKRDSSQAADTYADGYGLIAARLLYRPV